MAANRRIAEVPVSLEVVRRKVLGAIHTVERETSLFRERYLVHGEGDSVASNSYVKLLCQTTGKSQDEIVDFKDLDPLLAKVKGNPDINNKKEYKHLRQLVERGKMFEYIAFGVKADLFDAYEKYLQKYCLSYEPETGGQDLECVRDYEGKIIKWDNEIKEKFEAEDSLLDEGDKLKSPVSKYISNYTKVTKLMEDSCKALVAVCEPMKKWVIADSCYPKKIQSEINNFSQKRMSHIDVIKDIEYQREQIQMKLKRRSWYTMKVEKVLEEYKDEKRYLKRREKTIQDNAAKTQAELAHKKEEQESVRGKIKNRKENSPSLFNYLTGLVENLREEIRRLESKLELMDSQISSLRKEQNQTQKSIDRLQAEIESSRKSHDQTLAKIHHYQDVILKKRKELQAVDDKISALKRVRDIRLHSDTLRKIFYRGYIPGEILRGKDVLEEAFVITACDVGKDWSWLYQKLPFIPNRDYRDRTRDIEVIDWNNRRVDEGYKVLALKSLQKWRRLSTVASVDQLMSTLKKIKKKDTARRIERTVLSSRM